MNNAESSGEYIKYNPDETHYLLISAKGRDALRSNCPMRHKENGNCLPMGGFCTANGDEMCKALHSAYRSGRIDFQRELQGEWIEDDGVQICSHCGSEHEWETYRASFCDLCGADMRESNNKYYARMKELN